MRFKYSVVMPVYNTAEYVSEAIESVVNQTLSFQDNIELIIVNDGSTDGTGDICKSYAEKYPQNIKYLEKENGGVSAARNLGLEHATGKYVNFIDSDDKWSEDAFFEVERFLYHHRDIKIVSAKFIFFGAKTGGHPLNYKFHSNYVVDILKDVDFIQLSAGNTFMEINLARKIGFDTRLSVSEDFLMVGQALLREAKYGVVWKPAYYYRKRRESNSALDTSRTNKSFYLDTPLLCYRRLFDLCKQNYGQVIPFFQNAVMYDLQWRLNAVDEHPLTEAELITYRQAIRGLLVEIDYQVILSQRNSNIFRKLYALSLKYDVPLEQLRKQIIAVNNTVALNLEGHIIRLDDMVNHTELTLEFIEIKDGQLCVSGRSGSILPIEGITLRQNINYDSPKTRATAYASLEYDANKVFRGFFGEEINTEYIFTVTAPILHKYRFSLVYAGCQVNPKLSCGRFFPLDFKKYAYCILENEYVLRFDAGMLTIAPVAGFSRRWFAKRELLFQSNNLLGSANLRSLAWLRTRVLLKKRAFRAKKIWLILDRSNMAGDNGEEFFKYLVSQKLDGVRPIFVISKTSPDYVRLKHIGEVVDFGSQKYRRFLLRAEFLISAAFNDYILRPFGQDSDKVRDLMQYKFIFLQHGIIKGDMSSILSKQNKNIRLFVTTAQVERDFVVNTPGYGYSGREVRLTGLARHDYLRQVKDSHVPEKKLLLIPTWRRYLEGSVSKETGLAAVVSDFTESAYYKFFAGLINDVRLLEVAKETGTKISLLLHPGFAAAADLFQSSYVDVLTEYNYRKEFLSASIALTDYSSAIFDFALLEKPLVYAQFDTKQFFIGHWAKGYFEDDRDGFGPVAYDLDGTVEYLIRYMCNPVMEDKYRERVKEFFYTPPTSSCEQILEEILKLRR